FWVCGSMDQAGRSNASRGSERVRLGSRFDGPASLLVAGPGGPGAHSRGQSPRGAGMKFDELVKEPALLRAIRELGWEEPTPIQAQAIPPAREGRDVVGIAQTGTGKTAAFLIPALERQIHREGLYTLVLCPTRELAQQVAASARELLRYTE